jgi:sulfonate transport system ATP-binding protein
LKIQQPGKCCRSVARVTGFLPIFHTEFAILRIRNGRAAALGLNSPVIGCDEMTVHSLDLALNQKLALDRTVRPRPIGVATADVLKLRKVSKSFDLPQEKLPVLEDVSLDIAPGEFVCIVGASGCGKSTLLRLIAGLDTDYSGSVLYEGRPVTGPDLSRGIVFQEHRLFPWLTVAQNIELAFGATSIPRRERQERVREQIHRVGLTGFETAWPHQISGGMAQRAAIARALVNRPRLLLLDEPLGALDALTRLKLQQELQRLWLDVGITMVMVTHDIEEAVFLADRIVVMSSRPGRIQRVVPVPLDHPRERTATDFNAIKHDVLGDFSS